MLLDDLVNAIQTVQGRIREHGNSLSQNEYRTRLTLIDPILNALGWDVSNPKLVTPEYQAGNGRADYALLVSDGKPRAFIEAKRLNEPLEAHQDQVFKYTWDQKLFYGGLTDGNRWVLEDVTAAFSGRKGRLLDVTIAQETAYQCALKLLLIWRPTFAAGQPIEANEPKLVDQPRPKDPEKKSDPKRENPEPPVPTPPSSEWISLTNYEHSLGQPSVMRLPDNQEKQLSRWYEILENTAEWLIEERKLTTTMCPIKDIVSSDLVSEGGAHYLRYGELKNGIFFNKNKSAKDHLRGTKILLRHCGQDPAAILLKPSQ